MCAESQFEIRRLEHIVAHRDDSEDVLVAALTVHFDDSGTHLQAPVAVIGGWISPVVQWKRFTREWKKVLGEYGLAEFHMAEFVANNQRSEFADKAKWDERAKERLFKRLQSIINQRAIQGFCVSVIKQDYDEVFTPDLKKIAGEFHYTYALRSAIGWMEQWRRDRHADPIEYIFDYMTDGPAKNEIDKVFAEGVLMENGLQLYGMYPGCHSFRSRKDVLPLQAADILAWLSQRAHGVERQGLRMPKYAVDGWNGFLRRGTIAKYQTRGQMEEWVQLKPSAFVTLPEDWHKKE